MTSAELRFLSFLSCGAFLAYGCGGSGPHVVTDPPTNFNPAAGQWSVTATVLDSTSFGPTCPPLGMESATLDFHFLENDQDTGAAIYYLAGTSLDTTSPSGGPSTLGFWVDPQLNRPGMAGEYYFPGSDVSVDLADPILKDNATFDGNMWSIVLEFGIYDGYQIITTTDDEGFVSDEIDPKATLLCSGHVQLTGVHPALDVAAESRAPVVISSDELVAGEGLPKVACRIERIPLSSACILRFDPTEILTLGPSARPIEVLLRANAEGLLRVDLALVDTTWTVGIRGRIDAEGIDLDLGFVDTSGGGRVEAHGRLEHP